MDTSDSRIFFDENGVCDHALDFYTNILGFEKKNDIPFGVFRQLTVVSKDHLQGTELALEPSINKDAATYQKAMFDAGIPLMSFETENIQEIYNKLLEKGVKFTSEPVEMAGTIMVVFDDTCGNYIQIYQLLKN